VPEQDAHRQHANSEAGCRRSRNQLRVLSASTFAYDVNLVPPAARTKFINLRRGGSTGRAAVPRRGSKSSRTLGHFHHRSNVLSTNDTKSASSVGKG
jgi:hypothetical protein